MSTSAAAAADGDEDDDDFELFGSDDEAVDEAAEKLKQERLAAYEAKKSTSESHKTSSLTHNPRHDLAARCSV